MRSPLILILLLITVLSCHRNRERRIFSATELESIRQEFRLPKDRTFMLDTNYIRYLFSLSKSKYNYQIKNHYQPVQATYYNKSGQLVSFHVNCSAGAGVADGEDLNWNQQNAFDSFSRWFVRHEPGHEPGPEPEPRINQ